MRTRNPLTVALVLLALTVLLGGAAAHAQPFLGPETALSRPENPGAGARVAVAADGSFVAVWTNRTTAPAASDVFVRLFGPDGSPRGPEFSVANQARGRQGGAGVAVAGNGSFVVVWLVDAPGAHRLFARRFDRDGHPRGGPFPVTVQPTAQKDGQYDPGVAIAPDGRILVAWSHDTGVRADDGADVFDLQARFFADDGHSLGNPFVLEARFDEADLGRLLFTRDGQLVVLFQGYGGEPTFFDVYLKRFDANGAPLGAAIRINDDPETLPTSQLEPDFAFGADGSLFVVWTDNGADFARHPGEHLVGRDGVGLVGQRVSGEGALLGPPIAINRFFRAEQEQASVAATADGGFFVVWTGGGGQDGSGFGVFGRRYDAAGTPVSREYTLPLERAGDQVLPQIALNSRGKGVVTWTTLASGRAAGAFRLFKE